MTAHSSGALIGLLPDGSAAKIAIPYITSGLSSDHDCSHGSPSGPSHFASGMGSRSRAASASAASFNSSGVQCSWRNRRRTALVMSGDHHAPRIGDDGRS